MVSSAHLCLAMSHNMQVLASSVECCSPPASNHDTLLTVYSTTGLAGSFLAFLVKAKRQGSCSMCQVDSVICKQANTGKDSDIILVIEPPRQLTKLCIIVEL